MPLTTTGESGHHDFKADTVVFFMLNGADRVRCVVTLQALEKFDPKIGRYEAACLACFNQHRSEIENAASAKFDKGHAERDGTIMVMEGDLKP